MIATLLLVPLAGGAPLATTAKPCAAPAGVSQETLLAQAEIARGLAGTDAVAPSPLTLADFESMKASALFSDDDVKHLRLSHDIVKFAGGHSRLHHRCERIEDFGCEPSRLAHAFEPGGSVKLDGPVADDGLGAGDGLVLGSR